MGRRERTSSHLDRYVKRPMKLEYSVARDGAEGRDWRRNEEGTGEQVAEGLLASGVRQVTQGTITPAPVEEGVP
jgi:hypothetical protein